MYATIISNAYEILGETVLTAAKVINKCPSSSVNFDMLDYRWYGQRPDFTKLNPFGCRAYAHVRRGKLDTRAVKCVFLGYQNGVKGYRLWCQESQKVIVSRDVVFDESKMPYIDAQNRKGLEEAEIEMEHSDRNGDNLNQNSPAAPNDRSEQELSDTVHTQRSYKLSGDRPRREIKLPEKYSDYEMAFYALCAAEGILFDEPGTFIEAMEGVERTQWTRAMEEEIESLLKNDTWILIERSEGSWMQMEF